MSYRCLKTSDGRMRGLIADWDNWLRKADELYNRFLDYTGDSPFIFHEVACVGLLASAAAMAGFVPLAEYEIVKRGHHDKRTKVDGRADFWFGSDNRAYSFEFKRAYYAATPKNLSATLSEAFGDIARIQREEYHYAAAGLISRVRDADRSAIYEDFSKTDQVDLAYHIGPDGEDGAFLFFKLVG